MPFFHWFWCRRCCLNVFIILVLNESLLFFFLTFLCTAFWKFYYKYDNQVNTYIYFWLRFRFNLTSSWLPILLLSLFASMLLQLIVLLTLLLLLLMLLVITIDLVYFNGFLKLYLNDVYRYRCFYRVICWWFTQNYLVFLKLSNNFLSLVDQVINFFSFLFRWNLDILW